MSENKRIHVQHYYSETADSTPSVRVINENGAVVNEEGIVPGEIAMNTADEKLFIAKKDAKTNNDIITFSSDKGLEKKFVKQIKGTGGLDMSIKYEMEEEWDDYSGFVAIETVSDVVDSSKFKVYRDKIDMELEVEGAEDTTLVRFNNGGITINDKQVATVDQIPTDYVTEEYVNSMVKGGIEFKGVFISKPGVVYDDEMDEYMSYGDGASEEDIIWHIGDVIIVTHYNETLQEPTKEYILTSDGDGFPVWVELGDVSATDQRITNEIKRASEKENELLGKINANTTAIDQIPTDYAKKSDIPTDYVKSSHTDNSGLGNLARIYYSYDDSYDENPVINLASSNETYCSKVSVEDENIILNIENGDSFNICSSVKLSTNGITISGGVYNGDDFNETVVNINDDGVRVDNKVTATAFYESSDERLKIFKSDIDVDLDKLAELRKSYFTFVEDPGTNHLGVSAQEIKALYPEIVTEGADGYLKVDYSKLSVVALKAVDELNAKNKALEERLSKIEKMLNL